MPGLVAACLVFGQACERGKATISGDSASVPAGSPATTRGAAAVDSGWSSQAGPVLLVEGEGREEALVIYPTEDDAKAGAALELLAGRNAPVQLLGRGGEQLSGELEATPKTTDAQCRLWPLHAVHGQEPGGAWAIGFAGGKVAALPLDSVEHLSVRDSMALAAEASRLASSVITGTAPSFQGLRFTAHDIRRFESSPGVQAIVAHLIRRVNQEASPLEEQTLLIAERDSGATSGPYVLAYSERASGMEEEVTTPEVVGAAHIGGRPTLVIARDSDTGVTYSLVERTGPRHWRVRWTSGPQRCE